MAIIFVTYLALWVSVKDAMLESFCEPFYLWHYLAAKLSMLKSQMVIMFVKFSTMPVIE